MQSVVLEQPHLHPLGTYEKPKIPGLALNLLIRICRLLGLQGGVGIQLSVTFLCRENYKTLSTMNIFLYKLQ